MVQSWGLGDPCRSIPVHYTEGETALVIVRAVRLDDLDELWNLIAQATYGLTTLQINKEQLAERVELSNFAFTRKVEKPSGEPYVLVMEDVAHGKLVGLSCIFSKTGDSNRFTAIGGWSKPIVANCSTKPFKSSRSTWKRFTTDRPKLVACFCCQSIVAPDVEGC